MSRVGTVVRAVSSFYDVASDGQVLRCRARGRLRLDGTEPLPGDRVRFEPDPAHAEAGILTGILPRGNMLIRPSVANVDQIVFVASSARPGTDPFLIDRISVKAEEIGCGLVLCLNKTDLDPADGLYNLYSGCGFRVLRTSAKTGEGVDALREALKDRFSVLTGNSGVGKTSLLNALLPQVKEKTAEISLKHGRGKHTTRRTELFPLPGGGWLADTPGFAALDLTMISDLKPGELAGCFPEFPSGECRFQDCLHHREPDCAVQKALSAGDVSPSRYQSYLRMLDELQHSERF